jgi:hypothetical protein
MPADIAQLIRAMRRDAVNAVGAKIDDQIKWLNDQFKGLREDSMAGGNRFTSASFTGGSSSSIYQGATVDELRDALDRLMSELESIRDGTPNPNNGMIMPDFRFLHR